MKTVCSLLLLLTSALFMNPIAHAEQCQTLFAGQSIEVGSVCVENDADNVYVTYTTAGDWEMSELHLFVGTDFSQLPTNKKGNPQIGHFPFVASNVGHSYTFTLPLADLAATCSSNFAIAAHAVVGNGISTETAWGEGDRITSQGSWATWFAYQATCPDNDDDEPLTCSNTETGFALGQDTFNSLNVGNANRWGWQLTVVNNESGSTPIYAGAGQNNINNGDYVGDLQYYYSNGTFLATFNAASGYAWNATHLYADDVIVATTAPGQFGNQESFVSPSATSHYVVSIMPADAQLIYVVAHAEVCYIAE